MNTDLIIIKEYCDKCNVDPQFIDELENDGLIDIKMIKAEKYISADQLAELQRYQHLFYDLEINVHGIDAIHHMLVRIESLQKEIFQLRNRLSFFNG